MEDALGVRPGPAAEDVVAAVARVDVTPVPRGDGREPGEHSVGHAATDATHFRKTECAVHENPVEGNLERQPRKVQDHHYARTRHGGAEPVEHPEREHAGNTPRHGVEIAAGTLLDLRLKLRQR